MADALANQEYFAQVVNDDVIYFRKKIKTFAENVVKNPVHALTWGADSFTDAARLHVAEEIQKYYENFLRLDPEAWPEDFIAFIKDLRDDLLTNIMHEARSPSRSTSAQHNEMKKEIAAARAYWYEKLKRV